MEPFRFKYKDVNDRGQAVGFRSKQGTFDGETLDLAGARIPVVAVTEVRRYDKRFVLGVMTVDGNAVPLVFELTSGAPTSFKRLLDVARSRIWAGTERQQLESEGRGGEFRSVECPRCKAAVVLTGMPESPQLYCRFCDALQTVHPTESTIPGEADYRLCDECGMYSKPRRFTIFYFYFLLVVYGWRVRQTWRCPGCMRDDAWKMLLGNLIFVIGVPVAIVQLVRSYGGVPTGLMAGLDTANIDANRGRLDAAIKTYSRILGQVPVNAGIKYNLGRALAKSGRIDEATEALEMSLADCANYAPAFHALAECYGATGRDADLRALKDRFGVKDEEQEPKDAQQKDGQQIIDAEPGE